MLTVIPLLVSLTLLVVGAAISFTVSSYWQRKKEKDQLLVRLADLEKQVALTMQSVLPISAAFQAILIKELTHFHTPVVDALLEKVGPPFTLTVDEERMLAEALKKRADVLNGSISESERDAAIILPYIMKRVRAERRSQ